MKASTLAAVAMALPSGAEAAPAVMDVDAPGSTRTNTYRAEIKASDTPPRYARNGESQRTRRKRERSKHL